MATATTTTPVKGGTTPARAAFRNNFVWHALYEVIRGAQDNPWRVTAIPWVQENPDIPHPAVNGLPTQLQAVAEGGSCGGAYTYRWDWNGDGDYDDANETWRNASAAGQYAGYFAPLELDVQLPATPGDRLFAPKVQVDCGGERASATMPVLVRVDRICAGYTDQNSYNFV